MTKLNRSGYEKLIDEDIERLRAEMPHSLERDHIELVLRDSIEMHYPQEKPSQDTPR